MSLLTSGLHLLSSSLLLGANPYAAPTLHDPTPPASPAHDLECCPRDLLALPSPLLFWDSIGPPPASAQPLVQEVVGFAFPLTWAPFMPYPHTSSSAVEQVLGEPLRSYAGGPTVLRRRVRARMVAMGAPASSSSRPSSDDPRALMQAFMDALRGSCAWPSYTKDLVGPPAQSPFLPRLQYWWLLHCLCCRACAHRGPWSVAMASNGSNPCPFADTLAMLYHGWLYPFTRMPGPADLPNYDSVKTAPHAVAREFAKYAMLSVFTEGDPVVVSPIQVVVKDSDLEEAWCHLMAAGSDWYDSDPTEEGYVDRLNQALAQLGLSEVKVRICVDLARRVNRLLRDVKFRFPPVDSILDGLPVGGCITKLDYSKAFLNVPIHPAHHPYVAIRWDQRLHLLCRMLFGVKLGPCICSILSGETRLFFLILGVLASTYLDDSGATGPTEAHAQLHQDLMAWVATLVGWPVNQVKMAEDRPSQVMSFRGVLFDTIHHVMRIPPIRMTRALRIIREVLSAPTASAESGVVSWAISSG